MLKIQSRAQRAIRQAERALQKYNDRQKQRQVRAVQKQNEAYQRLVNRERRTARAEEKEDRILGPLAPRRAVNAEEAEMRGAVDLGFVMPPPVLKEEKIRFWNVVVGDRVVVLKGPDRHRIGRVKSCDRESNTVVVEGVNMVPVRLPNAYKALDPNAPQIMHREVPLNYNDVRLIVPLPDPETGVPTDTVVANIAMSKVWYDRRTSSHYWKRYIAGTNTVIPWPKSEPKTHQDQPADTRIMDVETVTYVPTLLKPPFPVEVMDELRGKYSRFRTRHDDEYVERKTKEEEEKRRLREARVRTPLQELNRKERRERKERGWPEFEEGVLERIGRVMAERKPELLEALRKEGEVATMEGVRRAQVEAVA
ncbi:hypothetical protein RUND412_007731 [Rhizina undulata]